MNQRIFMHNLKSPLNSISIFMKLLFFAFYNKSIF